MKTIKAPRNRVQRALFCGAFSAYGIRRHILFTNRLTRNHIHKDDVAIMGSI